MHIFWPGTIGGLLTMVICIFGYKYRKLLAKNFGRATSRILGKKEGENVYGSEAQREANLMLPIFGGVALGGSMLILSVTGVMK